MFRPTWCCLRSLRASLTQLRHNRSRNNLGNIRDSFYKDIKDEQEAYPRITVPQKMVENMAKHNLRVAKEKALKQRLKLSDDKLLIKCKRKELNHYRGQAYQVFDPSKLASYGWKNRNCPSDYFQVIAYGKNPSMVSQEEGAGFGKMELDKRILQFLEQEGINQPTNIQSSMIPAMVKRTHIACAAETGSGKTYAYLLPCVQSILQDKSVYNEDKERSDDKKSPSVVIIAPTAELVLQVKTFCDKMAETVGITSMALHGSQGKLAQSYRTDSPIDILIATPGRLINVLRKKYMSFQNLRTLVLDEADTLLDDSFNSIITSIFQKSEIDTSVGVQVVLVSATFPRDLDNALGEYLSEESFSRVTTDHLHQISKHVAHTFVKMKSADKLENLLTHVKNSRQKTMMIVCNSNDTCHWLCQTLRETNVHCDELTGFARPELRSQKFEAFKEGEFNILVCTDIATRGLDTPFVHHVINFDCPNFISDYIHRAGRVGRVGSTQTGHVTTFVVHPWDVDLVWKIEVAVRTGKPVHNVNANIKRKLASRSEVY